MNDQKVVPLRPPKKAGPPPEAIRIDVDVHRVVDECVEVIANDPMIFQRDGQLVHVVHTPANEADAMTLAGTPVIKAMLPPTILERLTRHASFARFDRRRQEWVPAVPNSAIVSALAHRAEWKGVRPLVGVIESPSLRPDGTVLQTPGYDAATGFLYVPNAEFPTVPERPTKDDAAKALEALKEPFADFPHASAAHLAVDLSGVLTVVARPAVNGNVPAVIHDAPTRGSGKTLKADAIATITTGRATSKMGYPATDEELEKVLGAYALRGAMLINFDNVTRPFGGGPIDRCLTAGDAVELRILGKSEVPSLRWRAVILATGNNVELHGDTARRVMISRLESPLENPEERTGFRHPDLLGWIRAERPRLVCAALTILRGYVVAGRPDVGVKSWGSFESWSALVPAALVWAGAADPMQTRPSADLGREPEKMALCALLSGLARLAPETSGMTSKEIITALFTPERLRGVATPDGFDDLRSAIEDVTRTPPGKMPSSMSFGHVLKKFRSRIVDGKKIVGDADRNGVTRWRVESAGVAGIAGIVSSPRARDPQGTSSGPTAETTPATPATPAEGQQPRPSSRSLPEPPAHAD